MAAGVTSVPAMYSSRKSAPIYFSVAWRIFETHGPQYNVNSRTRKCTPWYYGLSYFIGGGKRGGKDRGLMEHGMWRQLPQNRRQFPASRRCNRGPLKNGATGDHPGPLYAALYHYVFFISTYKEEGNLDRDVSIEFSPGTGNGRPEIAMGWRKGKTGDAKQLISAYFVSDRTAVYIYSTFLAVRGDQLFTVNARIN